MDALTVGNAEFKGRRRLERGMVLTWAQDLLLQPATDKTFERAFQMGGQRLLQPPRYHRRDDGGRHRIRAGRLRID
jgi:hypothetical protein